MNEQPLDALPPLNPSQQPGPPMSNSGLEASGGGQSGGAVPGPAPAPLVSPAANVPSSDPIAAAIPSIAPIMADDVDLIEKEWVERAKQIVEQTKQDPYKQNEAMMKMKTDYLKKRYNRDIKRDDV